MPDLAPWLISPHNTWAVLKNNPVIACEAACRRYQTINREPTRVHTVYEAENAAGLDEAFACMCAPHRYASNADWDRWVGDAITWQDATSFRPIFRYPG